MFPMLAPVRDCRACPPCYTPHRAEQRGDPKRWGPVEQRLFGKYFIKKMVIELMKLYFNVSFSSLAFVSRLICIYTKSHIARILAYAYMHINIHRIGTFFKSHDLKVDLSYKMTDRFSESFLRAILHRSRLFSCVTKVKGAALSRLIGTKLDRSPTMGRSQS